MHLKSPIALALLATCTSAAFEEPSHTDLVASVWAETFYPKTLHPLSGREVKSSSSRNASTSSVRDLETASTTPKSIVGQSTSSSKQDSSSNAKSSSSGSGTSTGSSPVTKSSSTGSSSPMNTASTGAGTSSGVSSSESDIPGTRTITAVDITDYTLDIVPTSVFPEDVRESPSQDDDDYDTDSECGSEYGGGDYSGYDLFKRPGADDTATATVFIYPLPEPPVTLLPSTTASFTDTVTMSVIRTDSAVGGGVTIIWPNTDPDSTSFSTVTIQTPTTSTSFVTTTETSFSTSTATSFVTTETIVFTTGPRGVVTSTDTITVPTTSIVVGPFTTVVTSPVIATFSDSTTVVVIVTPSTSGSEITIPTTTIIEVTTSTTTTLAPNSVITPSGPLTITPFPVTPSLPTEFKPPATLFKRDDAAAITPLPMPTALPIEFGVPQTLLDEIRNDIRQYRESLYNDIAYRDAVHGGEYEVLATALPYSVRANIFENPLRTAPYEFNEDTDHSWYDDLPDRVKNKLAEMILHEAQIARPRLEEWKRSLGVQGAAVRDSVSPVVLMASMLVAILGVALAL